MITVGRMTLRDLLKRHDIHTIRELTHRTGLSRQQCWNLWHGKTGVGLETVKLLHERLQIPLEELIQIDPPAEPKKRNGRPRKHREGAPEEGPAHE
jgi:transcriptional regulator with XRE-family HTH domain